MTQIVSTSTARPRHSAPGTAARTAGYQPKRYPRRGAITFTALNVRYLDEQITELLHVGPDTDPRR